MERTAAFQGERGAYSEEALSRYFGNEIVAKPFPNTKDVFEEVIAARVDYAVVPVENSLEGGVVEVMNLLRESDVRAVGEVAIKIEHCLICNPGANLKDIVYVYSHPQALGQCRRFIRESGFKAIPFYDTAGSVRAIIGKRDSAAIAGRRAASIYSMNILKDGIEDYSNNFTRFLVITSKHNGPARTGNDKTSIIFSTQHKPGELFKALEVFASRSVNLTRIESRPTPGKLWDYDFFVDFEGHLADLTIGEAMVELRRRAIFFKVLGSYPKF